MAITLNGTTGISSPGGDTSTSLATTNLSYTGTLTGGTGVIAIGTNQIYKDASGNVGIGTAGPSVKLHVSGGSAWVINSAASCRLLVGQGAGANQYGYIQWNYTNTTLDIRSQSNPIVFGTDASDWMTLNASGNLGLGVTPTSGWDSGYSILQAGSYGSAFGGRNAANTAYMISNAIRSGSAWKFINASATAQIQIENGSFYWFTSTNTPTAGGTATYNQAMTLFNGGNLVLGDTASFSGNTKIYLNGTSANSSPVMAITDSATAGNSEALRLNANSNISNAYFLLARNSAASFYALATNGASTFTSDETLKKNFELARDGYLADICKIPIKKYHWKTQDDSEAKEIGWIAQDVQEVFPGMVQESPEGTLMLKGSVMVPIMFKAIQELSAKVTALESKK